MQIERVLLIGGELTAKPMLSTGGRAMTHTLLQMQTWHIVAHELPAQLIEYPLRQTSIQIKIMAHVHVEIVWPVIGHEYQRGQHEVAFVAELVIYAEEILSQLQIVEVARERVV